MHPLLNEGPVRTLGPGILRFQPVQTTLDRFVLKVVVANAGAFARASTDVATTLREVLHGARVEVERHVELPPDASGKFRTVIARAEAAP